MPVKKYLSRDWLRLQFVVKKRSISSIAEECNVTDMTIRRNLEKFNLIRKTK